MQPTSQPSSRVPALFPRIPFDKVVWSTFWFLLLTNILTLTAVPWYIFTYGVDLFQFSLFFFYFWVTGFSITLGYHRLYSHRAFKAKLPIRLLVLLFGASTFENSVYWWASEHRKHHKHVDHDDDPYDITKGFFWAHIGWMIFKLKPDPPIDNVKDLEKDALVMFQHKYVHWIGLVVGVLIPMGLAWIVTQSWIEGLGAFLLAGVFRIVLIQHATFFINSLCHTVGRQPYSSKCSARDSWIMALFTFGEGYHNFHHEFQHDYRNGVKPWQFDPTKWTIWLLSKLGLASELRTIPDEKILLAELREAQRTGQLHLGLLDQIDLARTASREKIEAVSQSLEAILKRIDDYCIEMQALAADEKRSSRKQLRAYELRVKELISQLKESQRDFRQWIPKSILSKLNTAPAAE